MAAIEVSHGARLQPCHPGRPLGSRAAGPPRPRARQGLQLKAQQRGSPGIAEVDEEALTEEVVLLSFKKFSSELLCSICNFYLNVYLNMCFQKNYTHVYVKFTLCVKTHVRKLA